MVRRMSSADSKDEAAMAEAMAETIDSGSRPLSRPGADSGADTLLADPDEQVRAHRRRRVTLDPDV